MRIFIAAVAAIILAAGCGTPSGIVTPVLPHDPVDEGWKAVQNFEYSFNTKDLILLEETLDPEFVLYLNEEDWFDYNGDGILDTVLTEEQYLQSISTLFETYEVIELDLNGEFESPWYGDPSGQTLQLVRSYQKKAYNWVGGQQEGFTVQGDYIFLSKPDSTGTWRITGLEDQIEY